jgi:hypothetical protein
VTCLEIILDAQLVGKEQVEQRIIKPKPVLCSYDSPGALVKYRAFSVHGINVYVCGLGVATVTAKTGLNEGTGPVVRALQLLTRF